MKRSRLVNCIAFDDSPFPRNYRGDVKIVGAVFADLRFDGLLIGKIRKDGANSTGSILRLVRESKFYQHCNVLILQGVSFGGFNVVDAFMLNRELKRPILLVSRKNPDIDTIKKILLEKIPGGRKKWQCISKLGPMEPCHNCFVQRVGLSYEDALYMIKRFTIYGNMPEPLRIAHIIAGAVATGTSTGRV